MLTLQSKAEINRICIGEEPAPVFVMAERQFSLQYNNL